jgi:hypothetical protein
MGASPQSLQSSGSYPPPQKSATNSVNFFTTHLIYGCGFQFMPVRNSTRYILPHVPAVAQLVTKSPAFVNLEGSLLFS